MAPDSQAADRIYPVELEPPDISIYRAGNTGIPYFTTFDSGVPGPHLLVSALTHGNEFCGAIALDFLFRSGFRPARGRTSLGFLNVAAFARFDPAHPGLSRFVDEDFNRIWDEATLRGPRRSIELDRAREVRPLIDTVDYLLDIHSMQHATAPLMLAGPSDKGVALARRVGIPQLIVRDPGHAAGRRLRDFGPFADPASPRAALLVECGQHWERSSAVVARETVLRLLDTFGALTPDYRALHLRASEPPPQRIIEVTEVVTIKTNRFKFLRPFKGLEVVPKAGTLLGSDGPREIRTPYADCILIMPSRRLAKGLTAVRLGRYVQP